MGSTQNSNSQPKIEIENERTDANKKFIDEEINTDEISRKLKDLLKSNKYTINDLKTLFDVTYQTLDDILYKPKHWSSLTQRIKIVYMKIANYFKNGKLISSENCYMNDTASSSYSRRFSISSRSSSSSSGFIVSNNKRKKIEHDVMRKTKQQPIIEYDVDKAKSNSC